MATMTITLPESLKDFIESEVSSGKYGSTSEFFCEMLREWQKKKSHELLEMLLLEGLDSRPSIQITKEYLERRCCNLKQKFKKR
jgi:antitoxin ParD1/3/4